MTGLPLVGVVGPVSPAVAASDKDCVIQELRRGPWDSPGGAAHQGFEAFEPVVVPPGTTLKVFTTRGGPDESGDPVWQYRDRVPGGTWDGPTLANFGDPPFPSESSLYVVFENDTDHLQEREVAVEAWGNGDVVVTYTAHLVLVDANGWCVPSQDIPDVLSLLGWNPAIPQACDCQNSAADPVSTLSGNFHDTWTDLAVPGRGFGLTWTRSYNSLMESRSGPLGRGWTHRFNISLQVLDATAGHVVVHQESGSQLRFVRDDEDHYQAPPWVEATLVAGSGGEPAFTLTRLGGVDTFEFNSSGQLTRHVDRNGYETTLAYSAGKLSTITDTDGRQLSMAWTGSYVDTVTDGAGRVVDYDYTSGRLTRVTDVAGKTWEFGYETGSARLTSIRAPRFAGDPTPPLLVNSYDSEGRVFQQTDQLGRTTTFAYAVPDLPGNSGVPHFGHLDTTVFFPDGDQRVDSYVDNQLVSVTDGHGSVDEVTTTIVHDPATLGVLSKVDPLGRSWSFEYDGRGNRVYARDPLQRESTATFNVWNQPLTVTDPGGGRTEFVYDSAGNLELVRDKLSDVQWRETDYRYEDPAHPGEVTSVVDARGKTTTFGYDSYGYLDEVVDAEASKSTFDYNAVGWLLSSVAPEGNEVGADPGLWTTTYANHTPHGDPRTVTNPEGEATTLVYDEHRNVVSVTDAEGRTTGYVYDDADQLVTVQRADGTSVHNQYWPDGLLMTQVDGAGESTGYSYDHLGRLKSVTDPVGEVTRYWYDDASRLVREADPLVPCASEASCWSWCEAYGSCVDYGYNAAGALTSVTYGDESTPDITAVTYDPAGRPLTSVTSSNTTTWDWDLLGRLESRSETVGGTVSYTYAGLSDLVETITYPEGLTVTRGYDDAGRFRTVTDWTGKVTTFGYDDNSRVESITFPAGTTNVDLFAYDRADRMVSVDYLRGATTLGSFDYTRDDTGLLESSTPSSIAGDTSRSYTYSLLEQLEGVSGEVTSFDYDPADNLVRHASGVTQAFNDANQICWASPSGAGGACGSPPADATVFSFDAAGQRTGADDPDGLVGSYGYDQAHRLVSATAPVPVDGGEGQYHPLAEARVVDTRAGYVTGTCTSSPCHRLAAGETALMQVAGQGGVPGSGVEAVVLQVTFANPGAGGWAKINPSDTSYASAALTHFPVAGQTVNTMVVAVPDASGRIEVWTNQAVDVIVDVTGYYSTSSGSTGSVFEAVDPTRLVDTRAASQEGLCPTTLCVRPSAGQTVTVQVAGQDGLPVSGVDAVTINVTAESPSASGYLKINRSGGGVGTATLNYQSGKSNNMTTVAEVGADGRFTVFTTAQTHLLVDVVGYHHVGDGESGAIFQPTKPARVAKTAAGEGSCVPGPFDRLSDGETVRFRVAGLAGVPVDGVAAVVANVTIEAPSGAGFAKVNRDQDSYSAASTLHYEAGQSVNDVVVAQLDADGYLSVFTQRAADVIVDVSGWYSPVTGTWTYGYGAGGVRTSKTGPLGVVTTYTWDQVGGLALLVAETTGSETTRWVYGPGGLPVAQYNPDGSVVYLHHDQLGSTRLVTSTSGVTVGSYTYDAYGVVTDHSGAVGTPLGYGGQYHDTETGFLHLRARFYDPTTGQFLTRDPLEALTREAYGYVGGNPLNATDPSGLCGFLGDGPCTPGGIVDDVSDMCVDSGGNDSCNTVAEQHPESMQHIVNASGGVLDVNPITASLNLDLQGHGVNTSSGWFTTGQFAMVSAATGFGIYSGSAATFNTFAGGFYSGSVCGGYRQSGSCAGAVLGNIFSAWSYLGRLPDMAFLGHMFNAASNFTASFYKPYESAC